MTVNPIKLRVVSTVCYFPSDDPSHTDMTTEATISDDGEKVILEYDEFLSEDSGVTHTSVSFEKSKPGTVFLTREGEVDMTCVIEEKMRYRFKYDIGVCALELMAVGKSVKNHLLDKSKSAKLEYDMEMNGAKVQSCEIKIYIK